MQDGEKRRCAGRVASAFCINAFHAFGHGHYGLTQAAATADIVAALVAGRPAPIDPTPYAVTRFRR